MYVFRTAPQDSVLTYSQTPFMTADNINIGIGAIAETVEMAYVHLPWHS